MSLEWVEADRTAFKEYFGMFSFHDSIKRKIIFDVVDFIKRMGDDSFGDKPPEMNRVVYWLQHIRLNKYLNEQKELDELEERTRKKKRVKKTTK